MPGAPSSCACGRSVSERPLELPIPRDAGSQARGRSDPRHAPSSSPAHTGRSPHPSPLSSNLASAIPGFSWRADPVAALKSALGVPLVPLDLALREAFSSSSTLVYYAVAHRRRTGSAAKPVSRSFSSYLKEAWCSYIYHKASRSIDTLGTAARRSFFCFAVAIEAIHEGLQSSHRCDAQPCCARR